ncbi:MAG: hypothetical protein ACTIJJ_01110 [Galactobacter sp.]|uniref:hypothetical protein n=1 Tax=Galactobacter sp. TaxID=2676125 RepID=UPI0025B7E9AB|nr:hypothetical protein [Galactobacter sp.]
MSLTQRLASAAQDLERARALVAGTETPRWKGAAAAKFDERRTELGVLLVRVGAALQAAQALTAQFERAWWDEAAQQAASRQGFSVGPSR